MCGIDSVPCDRDQQDPLKPRRCSTEIAFTSVLQRVIGIELFRTGEGCRTDDDEVVSEAVGQPDDCLRVENKVRFLFRLLDPCVPR
jgi:hypothetical protein